MKQKGFIRILLAAAVLCLILAAAVLGINGYVKAAAKPRLLTPEEAAALEEVDCILILGCGVRPTGEPSLMLRDRLDKGLQLFALGAAPKLLMSGDHGQQDYDEVNVMTRYAADRGIASQDVFMDHAGFSTYESMYRARDVFCAEKVLIVSQRYHLYRAVYDARALGLDAWGVAAEDIRYLGQTGRNSGPEQGLFLLPFPAGTHLSGYAHPHIRQRRSDQRLTCRGLSCLRPQLGLQSFPFCFASPRKRPKICVKHRIMVAFQ